EVRGHRVVRHDDFGETVLVAVRTLHDGLQNHAVELWSRDVDSGCFRGGVWGVDSELDETGSRDDDRLHELDAERSVRAAHDLPVGRIVTTHRWSAEVERNEHRLVRLHGRGKLDATRAEKHARAPASRQVVSASDERRCAVVANTEGDSVPPTRSDLVRK